MKKSDIEKVAGNSYILKTILNNRSNNPLMIG